MSTLSIFKSFLVNTQYIFKNGEIAVFSRRALNDIRGHFLTDNEEQIKELNAEIAKGHPYIHVDPNESQVDSSLADPQKAYEAELTAKIRAQVIAELGDPNQAYAGVKNMGTTDAAAPLGGIGTTATLTGVDAANNPQNIGTVAARLAALKSQTDANNADASQTQDASQQQDDTSKQ